MRNWHNSVILGEKMKNINIVYKKIDELKPFDFKIEKTVKDIEEDDYEVVEPDEPKSKKSDWNDTV